MTPNACSGSTASPARTRPRLFGGSLSLHGACGSRAGAESTPRVPRSSDHPCASLHRDRLVGPTAGLTAPSARTHATAPRESSRLGPARSSAGGTPADTKVGSCLAASWPSWYLLPKGVRSPRNRVNSKDGRDAREHGPARDHRAPERLAHAPHVRGRRGPGRG